MVFRVARYSMEVSTETTSAYLASMSNRLMSWLIRMRSNTHSLATIVWKL